MIRSTKIINNQNVGWHPCRI